MALAQKIKISRGTTLLSYATLLAALIVAWLTNAPAFDKVDLLLIQTVPLLVFLPGIIQRKSMPHIWMSFVLLLYIVKAVVDLALGINLVFSAIQSAASITLFTAAMFFVRYSRLQRLDQQLNNPDAE